MQGYVVNLQQDAVLPVQGFRIDNPQIPLNEGWNYLPVPIPDPTPVEIVFADLDSLILVKDIAGPGVYWPEYNINTIGDLLPGKAYSAFLAQSATAGFTDIPKTVEYNGNPVLKSNLQSPWNPVDYAPGTHTVAFNLDENILQEGDVIGAFTGDNWCAGVVGVDAHGSNIAMAVNGGSDLAGFKKGESMEFRIYRPESGEIFDLIPTYNPELNTGYFEFNGRSEITDMKLLPTGLSPTGGINVKLYPNPNRGVFTINGGNDPVEVKVFNAFGEIIIQTNGSGEFIVNLQNQPKGTYIVNLKNHFGIRVEKVVTY